jgi:hypothetical protein
MTKATQKVALVIYVLGDYLKFKYKATASR